MRNIFKKTIVFLLSIGVFLSCSQSISNHNDYLKELYESYINNINSDDNQQISYEQWLSTVKGENGEIGNSENNLGSSYTGHGEPNGDLGNEGDTYIDLDTYNLYIKIEIDKWSLEGCLNNKSAYDIYINGHPGYTWGEEQWISDLVNGKLNITISFETFGGTYIDPIHCLKGDVVSIDFEPQKYENVFLGWFFDFDCQNKIESTFIAESDLTLYANYKVNQYKITWIIEDNKIEEMFDYGTIPFYSNGIPQKGEDDFFEYHFVRWEPELSIVDSDKTYKAIFEKQAKGYSISITTDEHVEVLIYETPDCSSNPIETNFDYSRDSTNGKPTKNNGQTNFKLLVGEGYCVENIEIIGDYKNLKSPSETGQPNLYRITKISSDLIVNISSKEIIGSEMIDNLSAKINENGLDSFAWNNIFNLSSIEIKITTNGSTNTFVLDGNSNSFEYQLEENVGYTFEFIPFYSSGIIGKEISIHQSYCPESQNVELPTVYINSYNNVLPTCDYISAQYDWWGAAITNNNYVQSSIKIDNKMGDNLFNSSNILKNENDIFSGAKIKIRGNTSAYNTKKSFKIKLNKSVDLLNGLYDRVPDNFKSKSFLLLNAGHKINYFFGREVSNLLQKEYDLGYSYVKVYLNGNFEGIYILSDSISEDACGIEKDGFIVECDAYWWNEDLLFNTPITDKYPFAYTFKYPDSDDINEDSEQYKYIKSYFEQFENYIIKKDNQALGFVNSNSFARWFFAQDLLANGDAGGSNMFVVKNNATNSPLRAGPTWDFDGIYMYGIERAAEIHSWGFFSFEYLFTFEDFKEQYSNLIQLLDASRFMKTINDKYISIIDTNNLNQLILLENKCFNTETISIDSQYDKFINLLEKQIGWMKENRESIIASISNGDKR